MPPSAAAPDDHVRNRLVAEANSLPDLVARAQAEDPQLAASLMPKALIASRSIWGVVLTMVISYAAGHWEFGWDANTCAMISGVLVLVATTFFRAITRAPISGLVTAKPLPGTRAP